MEINKQHDLENWVTGQTALLDPPSEWQPDPASALASLHARPPKKRTLKWAPWAIAAALAIAVMLPAGRIVAQQLWQYFTVRQVAFIRVKAWPEGVPSPKVNLIGDLLPPIPARDAEQARWRVNYVPRLPRPGVLSGTPALFTTFSLSAGTTVHVADLEKALQKAGITDQSVPRQWDGAQLTMHTSPVVLAQWPDIVLAQSLPLTLTAPSGFDFPTFSMLILRVLGVAPNEARRLAERAGTVPPWLAPIGQNLHVAATIEEITLNSGSATLVQEPKGTTLLWSVSDRVYVLKGNLSRDLAIAVANSVE